MLPKVRSGRGVVILAMPKRKDSGIPPLIYVGHKKAFRWCVMCLVHVTQGQNSRKIEMTVEKPEQVAKPSSGIL